MAQTWMTWRYGGSTYLILTLLDSIRCLPFYNLDKVARKLWVKRCYAKPRLKILEPPKRHNGSDSFGKSFEYELPFQKNNLSIL